MTFVWHTWTRYVLAWCLALAVAYAAFHHAWYHCQDSHRRDGNYGHVNIDFGGQWLMGRMLVDGHGQQLYIRKIQRQVLYQAYPALDQDPRMVGREADALLGGFMGSDIPDLPKDIQERNQLPDPGIGGPLYPPIDALYYYPLALLRPQPAYRTNQVVNLLLAFVCGFAAWHLARKRVWWPLASAFIMAFPGFVGSIELGQNATLSLTFLMWGWLLMTRGQPLAGGAVWGLLAFKPLWLLAFLLVPALTRRWRMCLGMLSMAAFLALLTLPFVGWHSWFHWLQVGRNATFIYKIDANWIHFSRDLLGIPQRWLYTNKGNVDWLRSVLLAQAVGWGLLLLVVEVTVVLALSRKEQAARAVDGAPAAFLLLGAWLSCLHFMYYDTLLAALPAVLLLTDPRRYLEPKCHVFARLFRSALPDRLLDYCRRAMSLWLPRDASFVSVAYRIVCVLSSLELYLVLAPIVIQQILLRGRNYYAWLPWDTFSLIALWLWCGWRWFRQRKEEERTATDMRITELVEPGRDGETVNDTMVVLA